MDDYTPFYNRTTQDNMVKHVWPWKCIYIYNYIHLCSNQISTLLPPPPKRKQQVFAHISHNLMKQNTRVWKYKAVPRIVLVWSVLPSTQRILHIVCKNLQEPTTNMTLNASWSSKDLLILFFRVFGWILRKTWFGVFKSKSNVYTMQVVDALHEVTCRFLESDARQNFVAAIRFENESTGPLTAHISLPEEAVLAPRSVV